MSFNYKDDAEKKETVVLLIVFTILVATWFVWVVTC